MANAEQPKIGMIEWRDLTVDNAEEAIPIPLSICSLSGN